MTRSLPFLLALAACGGDIYIDEAGPEFMDSLRNTGYDRPRVLHPGSKRGTPYSPSWDVHAAAGMSCLDCHATEGHLIAKGTHTSTMMANDLPGVEVSCLQCHDDPPHADDEVRVLAWIQRDGRLRLHGSVAECDARDRDSSVHHAGTSRHPNDVAEHGRGTER